MEAAAIMNEKFNFKALWGLFHIISLLIFCLYMIGFGFTLGTAGWLLTAILTGELTIYYLLKG